MIKNHAPREESHVARGELATADARAYILGSVVHPSERVDGSAVPFFDGLSLDLDLQIAEAQRGRWARLRERGEVDGWHANGDLELVLPRSIYELPVNTMVNFGDLHAMYGGRWDQRTKRNYWGRADSPVTDAERLAVAERQEYRERHRDGIDPLHAAATGAGPKRPKRRKDASVVYLAADFRLIRRQAGVFTTYQQALDLAPDRSTILEVPADGRTAIRESKLVRGRFTSGWGYASGYAPA